MYAVYEVLSGLSLSVCVYTWEDGAWVDECEYGIKCEWVSV